MLRIAFAAAIVILLAGCSSAPSSSPSTAAPSSSTAASSSVAAASSTDRTDGAEGGRLLALLLDDDEINSLRTSQDGPSFWKRDIRYEPDDLQYGPSETVDPNRCSDAVAIARRFEVTGWTGYIIARRFGPDGGGYGALQAMAEFPDAPSAQHAYSSLADKLRSCGNASGILSVKVSSVESGPFSIEIREDSGSSLRWNYIDHEFVGGGMPQFAESGTLSVVNNMVVYVVDSNISDAEPLSIAMTQALTQRILSSH